MNKPIWQRYTTTYYILISLLIHFIEAADVKHLECHDQWLSFKKNYNKSYTSLQEHDARKSIFCKNLEIINEKNAELGNDDAFGLNHMSDWTKDELRSLVASSQPTSIRSLDGRLMDLHQDLPEQIDYSLNGRIVGPVKNQGECGSCWAFGTTGLLEANEHKWDPTMKKVTPLSEQQLVDCMGMNGCYPNNAMNALDYTRAMGGLQTERDYRYVSGTNQSMHECQFDPSKIHPPTSKLSNFVQLFNGDENTLKYVLATYGPVIILMETPESFFTLKSYIYKDSDCMRNSVGNHIMLAVGYGTTYAGEEYWIVKNSWGTGWGQAGYAKIARNQNNMCGIASRQTILDWKP